MSSITREDFAPDGPVATLRASRSPRVRAVDDTRNGTDTCGDVLADGVDDEHLATPELSETERQEIVRFSLRSLNQASRARAAHAEELVGATPIRGHRLEGRFDLETFVSSLVGTGFQATALGRAIEIVREVRDRGIPLYLGATSNMGTCGIRDNITYLMKHRHLRGLAATAGAIEEDVMKVFKPFLLGDARADGAELFQRSICRTGNIFVPNARYSKLHLLLWLLNKRIARTTMREQGSIGLVEYVRRLGEIQEHLVLVRREESFTYWAWRNQIPIYCPVLMDGAIGDSIYYAKRELRERFVIDATDYLSLLVDDMVVAARTHGDVGLLAIGGSVPKHMLCNAAIFAGGAKYVVYVNTATEADGSNAGAPVDEAVSWGKVQAGSRSVKVEAEATLVVPLLLAAAFQEYEPNHQPDHADQRPHGDHA